MNEEQTSHDNRPLLISPEGILYLSFAWYKTLRIQKQKYTLILKYSFITIHTFQHILYKLVFKILKKVLIKLYTFCRRCRSFMKLTFELHVFPVVRTDFECPFGQQKFKVQNPVFFPGKLYHLHSLPKTIQAAYTFKKI